MKYFGVVACLFIIHVTSLFGITVRTATELQNAINAAAASQTPTTICVVGTITGHFTVPLTQNLITLFGECDAIISGGGTGTIFTIARGGNIDFTNLTLTDGRAPSGGAIISAGGVVITHCIIKNNTATSGNGGAIVNNAPGIMIITESSIFSNTAQVNGGAFSNANQLLVMDSKVKNNRAITGDGGAFYNNSIMSSGVLRTTLTHNSAGGRGGAIFNISNVSSPFGVQNSTVDSNMAVLSGGGIANLGVTSIWFSHVDFNKTTTGDGGGVFSTNDLNLIGSHVENNKAVLGNGGGVANENGIATITDTEIENNSAPQGKGGGLFNDGVSPGTATATLKDVEVERNTAVFGGGIANIGTATLSLDDSHVKHNKATGGPNSGGGIFSTSSIPLIITDSKVCENKPNQITTP